MRRSEALTAGPPSRRLVVGFLIDWDAAQRTRIAALCPHGIEPVFLGASPETPVALAPLDAVVVGTAPVAARLLDGAPHLRFVQRWGTGFDNIDPAYLRARGLSFAELPGINARSVSEFVLLAILVLLRHLPETVSAWSRGEWSPAPAGLPPRRLQGKTVGLLGFGAIGRDLARLLEPFEVEILFHDIERTIPPGSAARWADKTELLRCSDVVTVQLPLTEATRGAIGAREIAGMKPSAILVSIARAGVVDEAEVRAAVSEGRIAGASFDNFAVEPLPAEEIFQQPGILATPHIGGASIEGFEALIGACFESILSRCA